ncbi:hypothetical protein FOL47_010428, partial [Perkinsus chesapeaki]
VTLDGKLGARKDILDVGTRQRAPKSDQDISSVVTKSSVDAVPSASSILDTQKAVSEEDATVGEKESCELSGAVTEEALKGDAHLKKDANSASTSSFLDMIRNSGSLPQLDRGRMIVSPGAFDKKYELISPEEGGILGEGMNGAVRLARDRFTGEKVAVKTLSLVNLSPVKREMLYDEINIYLPLSHPNIVRLNEVYEEPGEKIILVMEACTGGELYERLAKLNRYSERDAAKIIRHILYAVSYLHSLNICHRDIKLENFVYTDDTEDSKLKLCDFGFGTIVRQGPNGATPLTAAMGSVHYVAPEVLEGKYGLQCDMWSVGVILYMLLSGTPPFDGADDREVTEAVRHAPLKLTGSRWDCISYSAKDLVSKLLCRDPYKRLTATQALQHEWCGSTDILKLNTAPNEIDVDVLKSMHTFTRCSAIQRAALGLIAQKRSDEVSGLHDRLKLMEETFKRMDVNNDGVITLAEFEDAVRRHVAMDEHEAEKIFGEISSCSSVSSEAEPVIHYRDFLAATIHSLRNRQPGKHNSHHHESGTCPREESSTEWRWNPGDVRSAFEAFDMERKGYVTKENLLTVLACDVTEVDRILKAAGFDPTKTDRIDFDDFSKLLHCREISIMEFAREDSESEEDNKVSRSVVEAARFAEEDEYEESLLGDSEGGSTNGTPRNGVMTLRPSRMPSLEKWAMEETEEPVQVSGHESATVHFEDSLEKFGMTVPSTPQPSLPIDRVASSSSADSPTDALLRDLRIHEKTGDMTPAAALAFSHHGVEAHHGVNDGGSSTPMMVTTPRMRLRSNGSEQELLGAAVAPSTVRPKRITRIHSMPSESYNVYQAPMFHQLVLKPFYQRHPISNVVMGLVMGTSTYARTSIREGVGKIIRFPHLHCGGFIFIPNPKFHEDPITVAVMANNLREGRGFETGSFRFVVWWIPEELWSNVEEWVDKASEERTSDIAAASAGVARENCSSERLSDYDFSGINSFDDIPTPVGAPGDFRFSDVPKPGDDSYLHTYRDLDSPVHAEMLRLLLDECQQFLVSLLGDQFISGAKLSMGFHYPVRTQYSTLHMQIRINSGDVVSRDGRGVAAQHVLAVLERDPLHYARDNMPLRYEVTENIKMNLLAAAECDSYGNRGGDHRTNRGSRGYFFNCVGLGQYELLLGGTECDEGGEYGCDTTSINVGEASEESPWMCKGDDDIFE